MTMNYNIILKKSVVKFLAKLEKSTPREHAKIVLFLKNTLSQSNNPCKLQNAKHLKGFSENHYRWRIGEYRIIGIIKNGECKIIEVVKITKRDNNTYKDL